MRLDFYQWINDKRKRGEKLTLTALLVDVDNSPLLKMSAKKMIEDDFALDIPDDYDLKDPDTLAKIDRMFIYNVNRYALEHLLAEDKEALIKATRTKAMAEEFVKLPNVSEEQKKEVLQESEEIKKEALASHEAVLVIKAQFEDEENTAAFIADGSVWFRDDKQVALDIIEEIEEVKDEEVNNLITASALVHRIDALISRINETIERLDMFIKGERGELQEQEEEIAGAVEMTEEDTIALTADEAAKEKIEATHLPDAKEALKREKDEEIELGKNTSVNPALFDDLDEEPEASPAPAAGQTP